MTPFDLETAIRELLPRTDLEPRPEVWSGVVERRARGEQVIDVSLPARTANWQRLLVTAVAAALVLTVIPARRSEREAPSGVPTPAASDQLGKSLNLLVPEDLVAQGSPRPAYRSVAGPVGLRVQAARWTYQRVSGGELRGSTTYESIRAELDGREAWLLVQPRGDSLWATRDSLRPIKRVRPVSAGRLEQFYRPGEILNGLTMRGFTSWTVDTTDSTQKHEWAMVRWTEIVPLLQGIPLHRGWTGSIPLTASAFGRTWFNLQVDGEEDITVPVGRFRCWRLTLLLRPSRTFGTYYEDHRVPTITLWVSQKPQWLVRATETASGGAQASMVLAKVDSVDHPD